MELNNNKKILPLTRCGRSSIIYGPSGSGKTTQLHFMADWLWKTRKLKTRIISAGGGDLAPFYDSGQVEDGIVEIYNIDSSKRPLADSYRLSEGYWPIGRSKPVLKDVNECKTTPEKFAELGMIAIDHISGLGNLHLAHMAGLEGNAGFKHSTEIKEDEQFIGGLQEGHYGIVHNICHRIMTKGFLLLPVPFIIVTALEGIGKLKKTSETIYGPNTVGAAQVADIPTWFGDCIHLEISEKETEETIERTFNAWFMQHTDAKTDIMYLAKPRVLPEFMPTLIKWANGEGRIELGIDRGIDRYYEAIDKLREARRKRKEKERETS